MSLFGRKKRTSTTTETIQDTLQRVQKLTYLQTLAIQGGVGQVTDVVQTTEASNTTINNAQNHPDAISAFANRLGNFPIIPTLTGGILNVGNVVGRTISSLFGSSRSTNIDVNTQESGWTITRQWLQPQFDIVRYALGIKELQISQFTYEQSSELVSTPWLSPKEIQKVTLIADTFIPPQFPVGEWMEFYIRPDIDGVDWTRINSIDNRTVYDSNGHIVPRIITFNTERPINSDLESSYITTAQPVKAIRFRAVFLRPDTLDNSTVSADGYSPVLRSYRLLIVPKGGLG